MSMIDRISSASPSSTALPINVSRRAFVGGATASLVLSVVLPDGPARAAAPTNTVKPGTRVQAFLEIRADGVVMFHSPFAEGGQGVHTAIPQIVGEELDMDPARFIVDCAPAGHDYQIMGGLRMTGGSQSVRSSYDTMRQLGASCRQMLLQAAASRLSVPVGDLTTEPGQVIHASSGRKIPYGDLAADAATLPVPEDVKLKQPSEFRWIGKPVPRLDIREKSTGKAIYAIDISVDGMLSAAIRHSIRYGEEAGEIANEAQVKAMPGVHSIHRLPSAVAVVADRWWRARRAAESLQIKWLEPAKPTPRTMPVGFSTAAFRDQLAKATEPSLEAEKAGDSTAALRSGARVIEAVYEAPYLAHAQIEAPSSIARFNNDGTLDIWVPNQAPEMFQQIAAKYAGIEPDKIRIHSPLLGGFFGRQFTYEPAGSPYMQAIPLAKAVGRPVKVIWSREEEFLRDFLRPMGLVRFKATIDANGMPQALEADVVGDGPWTSVFGRTDNKPDPNAVEGIVAKPYKIPNRRIAQILVPHPLPVGFWRSVGHSMNDFFYESFLDELADAGKQDPYELRLKLLADSPRHANLLKAVGELSGGWKRGPFTASDGTRRARGVAMASPFGSEVATIAEASLRDGEVVVHDVWVAIDPGSIVNPAIIEAQVNSAVAIGSSSALMEQIVYKNGEPQARNYDAYPILAMNRMPKVHVRIVESGAKMGGIGEPGVPGVPPAVANAISALTGQRIRSLPLSNHKLSGLG